MRRKKASFERHWAVKDVTLDINEGETFGIIGGNGAGKSTTLKMLAGILVPDEGSVTLKGRVSALLELGAGFHPELNGRENIFLNGAILGMTKRTLRDRFDEIVEFSGLADAIDKPVKTYSSGMYARLGFAVAVNVDPDILLIDEVLAVGDESFQRRCAAKITELREGGRTVVIVSHALGTLRTMCDRVAWFENGSIVGIGTPADTIDGYLAAVHPTAVIDEDGKTRTGSGSSRVRCSVSESLSTGRPMMLSFSIESFEIAGSAALSFTIRRLDGVIVGGTSTFGTELGSGLRCGTTPLEYRIGSLPLLPGTYDVGVRLTDATGGVEIDVCDHELRFDVGPGDDHAPLAGVVHLFGTWSNDIPGTAT